MKTKRKHSCLQLTVDYLTVSKLTIHYLIARLKPEYSIVKITKF